MQPMGREFAHEVRGKEKAVQQLAGASVHELWGSVSYCGGGGGGGGGNYGGADPSAGGSKDSPNPADQAQGYGHLGPPGGAASGDGGGGGDNEGGGENYGGTDPAAGGSKDSPNPADQTQGYGHLGPPGGAASGDGGDSSSVPSSGTVDAELKVQRRKNSVTIGGKVGPHSSEVYVGVKLGKKLEAGGGHKTEQLDLDGDGRRESEKSVYSGRAAFGHIDASISKETITGEDGDFVYGEFTGKFSIGIGGTGVNFETTSPFNEAGVYALDETRLDLTLFGTPVATLRAEDDDGDGNNELYIGDTFLGEFVPLVENPMPPVLLDLDGDGVELISLEDSTALFDVNRDGIPERLSWVGPDDGILVYDRDGDGQVSDPAEISFTSYLEGAQTDLEGLRHFDTNNDGRLTSADAEWGKFRVWRDLDQDGVSDPGELQTLSELNISGIGLSSTPRGETRDDGTRIFGEGTHTLADGTQRTLLDASFEVASWGFRVDEDGIEVRMVEPGRNVGSFIALSNEGVSRDVAAGEYSLAVGGEGDDELYNGRNGDGGIAGDREVVLMGLGGNDRLYGGNGTDALLGSEGNDSLYGGFGDDFLDGGTGNDRLEGGAGSDVYVFFGRNFGQDTIREDVQPGYGGDEDIVVFTHGVEYDDLSFSRSGDNLVIGVSETESRLTVEDWFGAAPRRVETFLVGDRVLTAGVVSGLAEAASEDIWVGGDGDDERTEGADNEVFLGAGGDDSLSGGDGDDALAGEAGADTLDGGTGDDALDGGDGDDRLTGGTGDDELLGGAGRDVLYGGAGDDTLEAGSNDSGGWQEMRGEAGDDVYLIGSADGQVQIGAAVVWVILRVSIPKRDSRVASKGAA